MKRTNISDIPSLIRFLFIVAGGLFLTSCNDHNQELFSEVEKLRVEIRDLKQLQYQVSSLENEVKQLSQSNKQRDELPKKDSSTAAEQSTPQTNEPVFQATLKNTQHYIDDPFLGNKDAAVIMMVF